MENLLECLKCRKSQNQTQNTEQLTCEPLGPRLWSHSECPMSCKTKKGRAKWKIALIILIETLMLLYPLHIFLGNKQVCFYDLSHTAFSFIMKPCNIVPLHSEPKHIWHHSSAAANKIPTATDSALAKCLTLIWQKDSWNINKEITKTRAHLINQQCTFSISHDN